MNPTPANLKILPKHFFKCTNLDNYFSANHKPINVTAIPTFYSDIPGLDMKNKNQQQLKIYPTRAYG